MATCWCKRSTLAGLSASFANGRKHGSQCFESVSNSQFMGFNPVCVEGYKLLQEFFYVLLFVRSGY